MRTGVLWFSAFLTCAALSAQSFPADRAVEGPDRQRRVVLRGNVHPRARAEFDRGAAPGGQRMEHMILVLKRDARQQAALDALLEAQQDPASPSYRQWLTPEEFGRHFGVSENDLRAVEHWLQGHGLAVDEVPAGRSTLIFSGTAAQVEAAFHTPIRKYRTDGQVHYANGADPEIPQALAEVVHGVVSLHDFQSAPTHVAAPAYTNSYGAHFLAPQDWATIYDVGPLYGQGLDGSGQSIAVLGRADITLQDVAAFRSFAGLAPNPPQLILNGDPGFPGCDDELESTLDVEWAGALARNAAIKFVTSKSGATDGIGLSAQYAVANNLAPIVSLSYLLCESSSGSAGSAFWNGLWTQAAAQGMSVLVAAGDSGAANCDAPDQPATHGRAVNAICSSPYSTCIGGTEFDDNYNPGTYWSPTNGTGMSSALSYIPELAWNESAWAGANLAGGGGTSLLYPKPSWQAAPGVPADGKRDVPDISAVSSIHDAYVVQFQGQIFYVAGTSAATPALASVLGLLLQNAGTPQGNINPTLYSLASSQFSSGGASVFHDVTSGNNSVPGVTGFNAGMGYDRATGLGSVDASVLVNHWADTSARNFALTASPSSVSVARGASSTASLALVAYGGFNSPVSLSAGGAPAGVTITFSSKAVTSAQPVTVTISAGSSTVAGAYPVTLTGTGAGLTRTMQFPVTVIAPAFTLTPAATSLSVAVGGTASTTLSTATVNGFNAAVALSARGLPVGLTSSFTPASIAAPANGSSTWMLKAATNTPAGVYTVTVTAAGGGVAKTQPFTVTVPAPSFTLTLSSAFTTMKPGASSPITVTTAGANGFLSAITLSISGLPTGVTAAFAPTSIAKPGNGSSKLTLNAGSKVAGGSYNLVVTATGGGATKISGIVLTVQAPGFAMTLGGSKVVLNKGGSLPITVYTAAAVGFNSAIALSISGLPANSTGKFSSASIAAPGNGSSSLMLATASSTPAGTYNLTVTGAGGGATVSQPLQLTVK